VTSDPDFPQTLQAAEAVLAVLKSHQIDAVMIGAMALAVHGYPRETVDLDLAVACPPRDLHRVAQDLIARGMTAEVRDPDGDDPLGGVIDVQAPGADLIQVVNFLNPPANGFPKLVIDSLGAAEPLVSGRPLRVVDAYHLVAFKLYAGGSKSKLDILELIERTDLDLEWLNKLCQGYRLDRALASVLALRTSGEDG
jgi:hypothetical protein